MIAIDSGHVDHTAFRKYYVRVCHQHMGSSVVLDGIADPCIVAVAITAIFLCADQFYLFIL